MEFAKVQGFRLHPEHIEKCIARLLRYGRKVEVEWARELGARMVKSGRLYESSSQAEDVFSTQIWNAGWVK